MSLPNEFCDLQARVASAQLRAEQSENREQVLQREFIDMRNRAELAEKSALDLKVIADHLQRQRAADNDAHGKDIADLQRENEILRQRNLTDPLIATTTKHLEAQIVELTRQRDAYKVEYESRAIWIEKMNAILGYDNSDGFHSSPTPHEIAQRMKDDLTHAFNTPGAGKRPLENDTQAPPRAELESKLDSLERDNDRLRAVLDGIKSSLDGIQTLVTLSE